jgi:hypothetical protein
MSINEEQFREVMTSIVDSINDDFDTLIDRIENSDLKYDKKIMNAIKKTKINVVKNIEEYVNNNVILY